jgi:choline dehydrogenase-like flavoprotein
MAQRIRSFAPDTIAAELTAADVPTAIAAAAAGWRALPGRSPMMARLARLVHDWPEVITGPLAGTPRTFLAGDWKMGNLGTHPDGRTILLDWALPGAGPGGGAMADARGQVHGIEHLHVADASIMPAIPAASTSLPAIMIAERVATWITADGHEP